MKIRSNKKGFSLAEILVSIAILAVIAAVVIPAVGSQVKAGDESRVESDLTSVRAAAEQFLTDVRKYPSSITQLLTRPLAADASLLVGTTITTGGASRWRGPYLNKDLTGAASTGFDVSITTAFSADTIVWAGQSYLILSIASMDTAAAHNVDRRMDDGVFNTGQVKWANSAATTTLKYYAIPVQ